MRSREQGFLSQTQPKPMLLAVLSAIAVFAAAAPAHAQQSTDLGSVSASGQADGSSTSTKPAAVKTAPMQANLDTRQAESVISNDFVRNDTSPVADFSQVVQFAPGLFSVSPNGPGLGDTKTYFRGFQDGDYTITFDGIPFNDTNSPTHHSWVFFPVQTIGGAVVDRSPGYASTVGPTNFGGSINFLSRELDPNRSIGVEQSYGTWKTKLTGVEVETGQIGQDGAGNLLINGHEMSSNGYQTYNRQLTDALSAKYQYAFSADTALTLFTSTEELHANTPNTKGPTRAQVAQFGDNYLASGNPLQANYYGYNFYHVLSDFEYAGIASNLGNGWTIEDKLYTYGYHNQQNYNGATITKTSATDKLNAYRTSGNILKVSKDTDSGVFRVGMWSENAATNRYQVPTNPLTWYDAALPNFHERFSTLNLQPYVEYQWNITKDLQLTAGVKQAQYQESFVQYADNGKTVGSLGGLASISHNATYEATSPSLDLHYNIAKNWAAYGQYSEGSEIPPTSVFDVKNANVSVLPAPVKNKTLQFGSVWQSDRFTFDADVYRIRFDDSYSSFTDPLGDTYYFASGTSTTQGIEFESNIVLGGGLNLYLNGTKGKAKYDSSGLWVANAPSDTETIGVNWEGGPWKVGVFDKRVGRMYNDNGSTHQAVAIDPFYLTNLFVNYSFKNLFGVVKDAKVEIAVTNLMNKQNIVGVTPASTASSAPAPGDVLTIMAPRSVSIDFKVNF